MTHVCFEAISLTINAFFSLTKCFEKNVCNNVDLKNLKLEPTNKTFICDFEKKKIRDGAWFGRIFFCSIFCFFCHTRTSKKQVRELLKMTSYKFKWRHVGWNISCPLKTWSGSLQKFSPSLHGAFLSPFHDYLFKRS